MEMLIAADMLPVLPADPYTPSADVVSWNEAKNADLVAEVFVKSDRAFGFRFQVWVAWRDAGNEVADHSWWTTEPEPLITDDVAEAQAFASSFLQRHGVALGEHWRAPN